MCIRYNAIDQRWERLIRRKKIWVPIPLPKAAEAGLFPGGVATIIRPNVERGLEMVPAQWGLQSAFAKSATVGKRFCYNARKEGSEERGEGIENMNSYRVPFRKSRCVVPAACFYERVGPAMDQRWIRVQRVDEEPILFAGLWSPPNKWTELPTYTIVTTAPPDGYVHDRIPVILEDGAEEAWMAEDAPIEGLRSLMVTCDPVLLRVDDFGPVIYKSRKDEQSQPDEPQSSLF